MGRKTDRQTEDRQTDEKEKQIERQKEDRQTALISMTISRTQNETKQAHTHKIIQINKSFKKLQKSRKCDVEKYFKAQELHTQVHITHRGHWRKLFWVQMLAVLLAAKC